MSKNSRAPKTLGHALLGRYQDFWIRFEVSPDKLRLFRFTFFALFALDAWLQIAHAPRYGYGDFNVSHFPGLDSFLPIPTRSAMLTIYVIQAYLGLRIALGGASRLLYYALAIVFSGGYFISQLNSYQHHYLLAIALILLSLFPWPEMADALLSKKAKSSDNAKAKNWPVRMLLIALSSMYFFAAITKLDGEWIDGTTLRAQLQEGWFRDAANSLGWSTLAIITLLVELALCFLLHIRRLWPLTIVIAVGMHLSFEFSGLDIGLFSYFMVALYLLLLPETWITWLSARASRLWALVPSPGLYAWQGTKAWSLFALALGLASVLWLSLPVSSSMAILLTIALLASADALLCKQVPRAAIHHLLAFALLLATHAGTDSLRDYYRFWGGNERRSGNVENAIAAYEKVVAIDPGYGGGRSNLGKLYRRTKRVDEALAQFEAGMAMSPDHFGVHLGAAQIYHIQGKGAEALRTAELAVKLKPDSKSARTIRDFWRQKTNTNAPR